MSTVSSGGSASFNYGDDPTEAQGFASEGSQILSNSQQAYLPQLQSLLNNASGLQTNYATAEQGAANQTLSTLNNGISQNAQPLTNQASAA